MIEFPKKSFVLTLIFVITSSVIIYITIKYILKLGEFSGYSIKIVVSSADGIGIGSPVVLSGVQIGKVSDIQLSDNGKKVIIVSQIKSDVKITEDVKVSLKLKGILGDRYIYLKQGESKKYLKDGDIIFIEKEEVEPENITASAQDVLAQFSRTLQEIEKLVKNINGLVEDIRGEGIAEEIGESAENIRLTISEARDAINEFGKTMKKISSSIDKLIIPAEEFAQDLTQISEDIKETARIVKRIAAGIESDGIIEFVGEENKRKIDAFLGEMESISPKIRKIVSKTEDVISRAESGIDKFSKEIDEVSSIKMKIGGRFEGGFKNSNSNPNSKSIVSSQSLFATLMKDNFFFDFGIVSPPGVETLNINTLFGIRNEFFTLGAGFLRSKPALQGELKPVDFFFIRGENIGFQNPNIRGFFGGAIRYFRIYAGIENILSPERIFLLGLEFTN